MSSSRTCRAAGTIALIVCSFTPQLARAAFTTPSDARFPFQWTRPADDPAATAGHTTYQEWDLFTSELGPNAPDVAEINPNGVGDAYDSAAADSHSFVTTSGNIYSNEGIIKPRATAPSYGLGSGALDVLVQLRVQGNLISTGDVKVNGVLLSSYPNYSYNELSNLYLGPGMFQGYRIDHAWTVTLPADAAQFQLDWGWGVVSASFDRLSIDTHVGPGALGLASDGDFDDDGDKDAADIDILWRIVRNIGADPNPGGGVGVLADTADLDGNSLMNEDDVDLMLASKLSAGPNIYYGDANLTGGTPELTDFNLWRTGTGGWAQGDFDGSGGTPELTDFNLWRTGPTVFPTTVGSHGGPGFGASAQPSGAPGAPLVPEPATIVLMGLALPVLALAGRRRRALSNER